ncbi:MAG: hypothetical protein AABY06_02740 [Nanoarchaeota archaeon]
MTNKKSFLYSNREMILPDKIEVSKKIINQYNFIEEIYKVNIFKNITRFCTLEKIHDAVEIHRFYEIIDNDPNKLTKLNQKFYDREFRIGLGGRPIIPNL